VAVLHLAMVHGAVYDAVNSIDRRYEPYLVSVRARPWFSKDAAAATAAYRVLVGIVPAQQPLLQPLYAASLASVPDGKAKAGGIVVGEVAAAGMLAARAYDGRFGPYRFPVGSAPGEWRPTPPGLVNDPNAWVADVRPFLIDAASDFAWEGPNRVRAVPTRASSTRSRRSDRSTRPPGPRTRPTSRGSGLRGPPSGHASRASSRPDTA
jgi:hypothetical protein